MKKTSLLLLSLLSLAILTPSLTIAEKISKQSDISVIAYTIYAEARGEGQYGMCLVGSVIWNRSQERNISAKDVCLQRLQFSCWNGISSPSVTPKAESDQKAWEYANMLAKDILSQRFKPFTTANHYYNPDISNPSWGSQLRSAFAYKHHRFGVL